MKARRLWVGLAAAFFGVFAAASTVEGSEIGPVEEAAVTLGCADLLGATILEFFGFITDSEEVGNCLGADHSLTAVWDDDWYGNPGNSPMR